MLRPHALAAIACRRRRGEQSTPAGRLFADHGSEQAPDPVETPVIAVTVRDGRVIDLDAYAPNS